MTRPREAPKFVPAPGIAGGIDDFIAFLELEKGLSRNTCGSYEKDLLQFGDFLRRKHGRAGRCIQFFIVMLFYNFHIRKVFCSFTCKLNHYYCAQCKIRGN